MRQFHLIVRYNTEQICCTYKSNYNNKRENQVILLMTTDGKHSDSVEKRRYLTLKK